MMLYSGQPFASPDEALAHHGVKGQKWGVIRKHVSTGAKSIVDNIVENDRQILAARAARPTLRAANKAAKKQYRVDRKIVGRKEARKALTPIRKERWNNLMRSMDETSAEKTARIVTEVLDSRGRDPYSSFRY